MSILLQGVRKEKREKRQVVREENQSQTTKVSVVVPVFNNASSIPELISRINLATNQVSETEFEIIFVDDGSVDDSFKKLQLMQQQYRDNIRMKIIKLKGNFGQLGALFAGYSHAQGNAIVSMAADLQDPPELIVEFVNQWKNGKELVYGDRSLRTDGVISRLTSLVAYGIIRRWNSKLPLKGFDFYLMTSELMNYLLSMNGRFRFLQADLMKLDVAMHSVQYHRNRRKYGKSGYSLFDRWQIFLTALVDTSYRWIQIFSLSGITFSLFGLILMMSVIIGFIIGDNPFPGFTFLACLILLIGGLQLLLVSLIGEYIWRSYDILRSKPLYVIDTVVETISNQ